MMHEKSLVHFKEWLGYFLSISEININAIDRNNCTAFDLLFLHCIRSDHDKKDANML